MKGKFIVVEGIDGSGKSTLIQFLSRYLLENKKPHICTKEPGGSNLGEKIRHILFDQKINIDPIAELMLLFAARRQHYLERIEPKLNQGNWVICDRFIDSTYAYQSAAKGVNTKIIKKLEKICYGNFKPDLVLWLDLPVDVAFSRVFDRNNPTNRFEMEKKPFFEKVNNCYRQRYEQFDYIYRLDACLAKSQLQQQAINILKDL